jgi:hypothetical protein
VSVDVQQPTARSIPYRRRFAYALVCTVFALGLLEGACRLKEIWRPPIPYSPTAGFVQFVPVFQPCADVPGSTYADYGLQGLDAPGQLCTDLDQRLTYNVQSFAAEKPSDVIRIVMMGGSSVYALHACETVAPEVCLDALARRLTAARGDGSRVEIINCGANSYGSARLAVHAGEMIQYDADLLLLYSGHNEREDVEQIRHVPLSTVRLQRSLGHSALYRGMRDVSLRAKARRHLRHGGQVSESAGGARSPLDSAQRMAAFETNLEILIELFREQGTDTIIGTVPSNLVNPLVLGWDDTWQEIEPGYGAGDWARSAQRAADALAQHERRQSSGLENDVIRAIAEEHDLALVDVEEAVEDAEPHGIPGETLFIDHCHLDTEGNRLLLEAFEREILAWMARR